MGRPSPSTSITSGHHSHSSYSFTSTWSGVDKSFCPGLRGSLLLNATRILQHLVLLLLPPYGLVACERPPLLDLLGLKLSANHLQLTSSRSRQCLNVPH